MTSVQERRDAPALPISPALRIEATGPLALLQDAGRPGSAHLGVPASGAADRSAYAAANRLVGNRAGAACIETVFGGLVVRALRTVFVAVAGPPALLIVTGADGSTRVVHPVGYSFLLDAGETVTVGVPEQGLRHYLAVRGGIEAERVLGSRATDVLSGLGPVPLEAGAVLATAGEHEGWPAADHLVPAPVRSEADGPIVLDVSAGPRADWFGEPGLRSLRDTIWTVSPESNRVGVRLTGEHPIVRLPGRRDDELPSEAMVAGAAQVPPSGFPVLFLRDHPVTGGYPVIAVLTEASVDALAQLRPGEPVRMRIRL